MKRRLQEFRPVGGWSWALLVLYLHSIVETR